MMQQQARGKSDAAEEGAEVVAPKRKKPKKSKAVGTTHATAAATTCHAPTTWLSRELSHAPSGTIIAAAAAV